MVTNTIHSRFLKIVGWWWLWLATLQVTGFKDVSSFNILSQLSEWQLDNFLLLLVTHCTNTLKQLDVTIVCNKVTPEEMSAQMYYSRRGRHCDCCPWQLWDIRHGRLWSRSCSVTDTRLPAQTRAGLEWFVSRAVIRVLCKVMWRIFSKMKVFI